MPSTMGSTMQHTTGMEDSTLLHCRQFQQLQIRSLKADCAVLRLPLCMLLNAV